MNTFFETSPINTYIFTHNYVEKLYTIKKNQLCDLYCKGIELKQIVVDLLNRDNANITHVDSIKIYDLEMETFIDNFENLKNTQTQLIFPDTNGQHVRKFKVIFTPIKCSNY